MSVDALTDPQMIKISSKRQITIPARWYKEGGFKEYALCTWTDDGLLLQPLDASSKDSAVDATIDILRALIAQGYEGDELLDRYQRAIAQTALLQEKIARAENDISEGRVAPYENTRQLIRECYAV